MNEDKQKSMFGPMSIGLVGAGVAVFGVIAYGAHRLVKSKHANANGSPSDPYDSQPQAKPGSTDYPVQIVSGRGGSVQISGRTGNGAVAQQPQSSISAVGKAVVSTVKKATESLKKFNSDMYG